MGLAADRRLLGGEAESLLCLDKVEHRPVGALDALFGGLGDRQREPRTWIIPSSTWSCPEVMDT